MTCFLSQGLGFRASGLKDFRASGPEGFRAFKVSVLSELRDFRASGPQGLQGFRERFNPKP